MTFDTSIDSLLQLSNHETINLSDWNISETKVILPNKDFHYLFEENLNNKNTYCFSDEMTFIKNYITTTLSDRYSFELSKENISIFSNGTSSGYLFLYSLNKMIKDLRVLLITPTYFSYLNILDDMGVKTFEYAALIENNLHFNPKKIEQMISENKINLVIVTNPLFGSGLEFSISDFKKLLTICKQYDCYIFIDNLYGGMNWLHDKLFLYTSLIALINDYSKIIIIDSLAKKLFLNGLKYCITFGNPALLKNMEANSVYIQGTFAYSQLAMIKHLFDINNISMVEQQMERNLSIIKNNYALVIAMIQQTNIKWTTCSSGYYMLMGIPFHCFEGNSSMDASIEIMKQANILTIPHDRYLHHSKSHHWFRVNLLLEKKALLKAIRILLSLYA